MRYLAWSRKKTDRNNTHVHPATFAPFSFRRREKQDFVFLNDGGKPYLAGGFRLRLQRWCKRAGVPKMPPYALRHVFGTRQAGNGTNQAILAQLMGHSNLQTTARYVVNCDEAHLKAVDSLAESVMSIVKPPKGVLSIAS